MRALLAASIFAIGSSFVLVALKGGDHIVAAVTLMAACSTAAIMIRALAPGQLVDHLNDAGDPTRDGDRVISVTRVRHHTL